MNPILISTEDACIGLAYSASLAVTSYDVVNIYPGINNTTKVAPAVICYATRAEEIYHGMGMWKVSTEIKVKEKAADVALSGSGDISSAIDQAFLNENTVTDLNNQISNYFVYDVFIVDNANTIEGEAWVQTLSLDIICCLTD